MSDADKEPEIVNFKSPNDRPDPREAWKVDVVVAQGPRFGASKVPDAITQTDNSEKRQQNAALRTRNKAEANEPEALKQMRLAREREEAAAVAEAERRSANKDFITGQDVREQRLIDEYNRNQASGAPPTPAADGAAAAAAGDIRTRLKAMQGSGSRRRADKEALLHQSQRSGQSVADVAPAVIEFMNRALPAALGDLALALDPALAAEAARSNAFMNGALRVPAGRLVAVDERGLTVAATVVRTGFFGNTRESTETVRIPYPRPGDPDGAAAAAAAASSSTSSSAAAASPGAVPAAAAAAEGAVVADADELKVALMGMLRGCGREGDTAAVLEMPGVGSRGWAIPDNLFLNEVPCDSDIREWFYRDACDAVQLALDDPAFLAAAGGRLRIECVPPEINPEMDTFRVGTMLELVREIAIRVAVVQGRRVKICIQGPMGQGIFTGMPLMLSGMRKVLESMDWQARPGEMYEGLIAQDIKNGRTGEVIIRGSPDGKVAFGEVSAEEVESRDEVLLVIAPQNMVGASVYEPLSAMVAAAAGRPVILINPRLQDRQSSSGIMSVQGRQERITFAASFRDVYHFRLLYRGSTFMFPIQGAIRYNFANARYWTVLKREATEEEGQAVERYRPLAAFAAEPDVATITRLIVSAGSNNA